MSEVEIGVICRANDEKTFTDKLHVMITQTESSIDIDLTARASGQTLYDYKRLRDIDFGT